MHTEEAITDRGEIGETGETGEAEVVVEGVVVGEDAAAEEVDETWTRLRQSTHAVLRCRWQNGSAAGHDEKVRSSKGCWIWSRRS